MEKAPHGAFFSCALSREIRKPSYGGTKPRRANVLKRKEASMKRNARFAETRETGCDFGVLGASVAKGGGGSLPRTHAPDPLAVQVLNGLTGAQEVSMGGKASRNGWKISQVERLIELPRRDIQRSCYQGQGGVAILSPKDSSWGRRSYDCEDVAKLFVVKQFKSDGRSLPEAKRMFARCEERGEDCRMLLASCAETLREREDEARRQREIAESLLCALSELRQGRAFETAMGRRAAVRFVRSLGSLAEALAFPADADGGLCRSAATRFSVSEENLREKGVELLRRAWSSDPASGIAGELWDSGMGPAFSSVAALGRRGLDPASDEALRVASDAVRCLASGDEKASRVLAWLLIDGFLDGPGMELLIDLWLGAGSYDFAREVFWACGATLENG